MSSKFTDKEKSLLTKLRTRMIDVKTNFKNKYQNSFFCDLCGEHEDQVHLLECQVLIDNCEALYEDSIVEYDDIFCSEEKQLSAVKLFKQVLETRQKLLDDYATRDINLV